MELSGMRKYIRPGRGVRFAAALFTILAILCAVLSVFTDRQDDGEAVPFRYELESGVWSYVDIVAVSDWVAKSDSEVYYTVIDAAGSGYTMRLTQTQYDALAPQSAYWNDDSPETLPPAPARLCGISRTLGADVREVMAQSWEMDEAEFTDWFGSGYLDATSSPSSESSLLWLVLALLFFLVRMCFVSNCDVAAVSARRCLKQLEKSGQTDAAEADFAAQNAGQELGAAPPAVYGRRFFFVRRRGIALPYSDLLWGYKHVTRYNFVFTFESVVLCTAAGRGFSLPMPKGKRGDVSPAETLLTELAQRCPDGRWGFTPGNRRWYKEQKNARKMG